MPAAVNRFLATPALSRDYGDTFPPAFTGLYKYKFGRDFDALVFLDVASASRLTNAAKTPR
jgi:hypothetical protein